MEMGKFNMINNVHQFDQCLVRLFQENDFESSNGDEFIGIANPAFTVIEKATVADFFA